MRALVFAILVAGCGGSQSASPATPAPATPAPAGSASTAGSDAGSASATTGSTSPAVVDGMLDKMSEFKDKICACPDQVCIDGIEDDMKRWGDDLAKHGVKNPQLTDAQAQRGTAIGEALGKCLKRIGNMGG